MQATNSKQATQGNKQATVTILQQSALRMQRLAKVKHMLLMQHIAAKQAKHTQATYQSNVTAYQLAVQQLQAQYGVQAPVQQPGSAVQRTTKAAPSAALVLIEGVQYAPVKAVHALYCLHKGVRKAVLQAAADLGINPSTAATQYAIAKKASAN